MPDFMQLGPFVIKFKVCVYLAASFIGLLVMKYEYRRFGGRESELWDKLYQLVMCSLFAWKLSPVLFTPSLLWKAPIHLLLENPGADGVAVGAAAAVIYTMVLLRKSKTSMLHLMDLLPSGILTADLLYSLIVRHAGKVSSLPWAISIHNPSFRYHPVNMYATALSAGLLVWFWRRKELGSGQVLSEFLMLDGLGRLVLSYFEKELTVWHGLSSEQWTDLFMVLAGMLAGRLVRLLASAGVQNETNMR